MAATAVTKERGKETLSLEERIRRRAYELKMMTHPALLYVERGNQSGSELDDWPQAEEETERGEEQRRRSRVDRRVQFERNPGVQKMEILE